MILFDPRKMIKKGMKQGFTASVASMVVIQFLLEEILGVQVSKEQLIEVSGAIGVISGTIKSALNWYTEYWKKRNN